jgi:hypothetical protein
VKTDMMIEPSPLFGDPIPPSLRPSLPHFSSMPAPWAAAWPTLQETTVYSTTIADLGEGHRLRFPLTVKVERFIADDEFVASWPEVEAWGSGGTDAAAINSLKDQLRELYADLRQSVDDELGPLPRRWKRALVAMIEVDE